MRAWKVLSHGLRDSVQSVLGQGASNEEKKRTMRAHEKQLASSSLTVKGEHRGPWSENANKPRLDFTNCLSAVCLSRRRSRLRGEEEKQGCLGQFTASQYNIVFFFRKKKVMNVDTQCKRMTTRRDSSNHTPIFKEGKNRITYKHRKKAHGGARMYTVHTSCVSACAQAHTNTHEEREGPLQWNRWWEAPVSGP